MAATITLSEGSITFSSLTDTTRVEATVLDAQGATLVGASVTWTSSDPSVATVDSAGLVTAVNDGSADVTASSGSAQSVAPIMVSQAAASVVLSADTLEFVSLGDTATVGVTVLDAAAQPITGASVTWTSSDGSVASVSVSGLLTSLTNGASTITATSGTASATATVAVAQVTSTVALDADTVAFASLGDTLRLTATVSDANDAVISGASVTWASSDVAVATVDADGLVTSVTNGSATITATSGTASATAEVEVTQVAATITLSSIDLTLALVGDTSTVTATVLDALGETISGATVMWASSDTAVATVSVTGLVTAVANGNATITATSGTGQTAQQALSLNVLDQASLTVGVPVTGLSAEIDQELLFRVDVAGPTTLTVSFNAPNGDADLYVAEGARPGFREDYLGCRSTSPISVESCQVPFAEGTYHILVHAYDQGAGFSGGTITVTEGEALIPYDIELVFVENGTQSQEDAFTAAAAKWTQIIVADVPDVDIALPADYCMEGQPIFDQLLDDVVIFVDIGFIDGQGGTLGQAGPCITRSGSNQTMFGIMQFDEADLVGLEANGQLESVILHEIGHVLGIGTHWNRAGLLQNPSLPDNSGADTHFVGPNALTAFDNIGGGNFVGSKVPVENEAGQGSGDSHWRETTMDTELMTPFLDLLAPLSEVTIASLKDLGYGVDLSQGDNFFLPSVSSPQQAALVAPGAPSMTDLGNDIWAGRRYVIDKSGRIREILR